MAKKKEPKPKMPQCPVEGCTRLVHPDSKIGLCYRCTEIAAVVVWVLPRVKVVQKPAPDSLLVPKPGMGDKAVKEAQAASKLIIPGGNR